MNLFTINNVSKSFSKLNFKKSLFKKVPFMALDDVSLHIKDGEAVAIVGANGSGKTTLLNIMTGLYHPDQGQVLFKDSPIEGTSHLNSIAICLPNGVGLIPDMKVREYLTYKSKIFKLDFDESSKYIDLLQARKLLDKKIVSCSAGEAQRVNILSTIISDATVLLFDEPTNSLDLFTKYIFLDVLTLLKSQNKTIILISHHTDEIIKMDRLVMLFKGKVFCDEKMPQGREEIEEKLMDLCSAYYEGGLKFYEGLIFS